MKKTIMAISLCFLTASFFLLSSCSHPSPDYDLLIVKAKVIDGTGNPGFYADIGIKGETIVAVGDLTGKRAAKKIDAQDLVAAPGFIDVHTHCDGGLGKANSNANLNYLIQGTTTVITGNCGSGTFKIAETKTKWEDLGIGTNAIHLVGFGDVRQAVMGREARPATPEEIEKMKAIVRQAMKEGAWGLSTGLEYIPDRYSTTEEIIELAKVVAEFGGVYASHQRNEFDQVPEATKETIRIAKEAGLHAEISHLKICRKNYWGGMKEVVALINKARSEGIHITADMYPYNMAGGGPVIDIVRNSGWSPFRLPPDLQPFADLRLKLRNKALSEPERAELKKQYLNELKKALSDKSKRELIKKYVIEGTPDNPSPVAIGGWDSFVVAAAKKNAHLIGKIISDLAQEEKRDAFDIVAELALDESEMYVACGVMSEEDMKYAIKQEWLMFCSDGDALPILKEETEPKYGHPRAFSSQARVLRKYVREDELLTLEEAVRKITSLPASFLDLKDRGQIKEGYKADIVIFDPNTISDRATFANCQKYSTGTKYVIVNGKLSIEEGHYHGALNGKMLLLTANK